MPGIRRRPKIIRQTLTPGDLTRIGCGLPLVDVDLSEQGERALYLQHRERIIRTGNHGPLHCAWFWGYEPAVPAELRELPDPPDYRLLLQDLDDEGYRQLRQEFDAHPYTRTRTAREAWLAAHPVG